jgi:glycosyltransferase involved in cell wall biosynthesis
MRVCIVGPVTPFRSGIARHTTALLSEMARRAALDIFVVSFSRLYPRFLYPGESDTDMSMSAPGGVEVKFCLDSIDPLSWKEVIREILSRQPDLVVIPAWSFFVAPCLGFIARALRRKGIPVTMIVHNVEDHEAVWWKRALSRFQLRQASRFLTHNAAIDTELRRLIADKPIGIHPHPVYDSYPEPKGQLARTASLELLFFGLVRPYKGLDTALRALAASGLPDVRLAVVGEFWQGRTEIEALIRELDLDRKVELVPRYVTDQEAAEYFARCDAVIAPYRSATGSGVVALAQWYGRPVVASNVPGLSHAVIDGSSGWLFAAGDHIALARLLKTRISRSSAEAMRPHLHSVRKELSWKSFADAILNPELQALPRHQ